MTGREASAAGAAVRLRRSRSAGVAFDPAGAFAFDYLTRARVALAGGAGLELLGLLGEWSEPEVVFARLAPVHGRECVATELLRLIDAGLVVVEGTERAGLDARHAAAWEWGPLAGGFHYGLRGTRYEPMATLAERLAERMAAGPPVELFRTHGAGARTALPRPAGDHPTLSLLKARRSRRAFADAALPLGALADCLFAGMAIVGFADFAGPGSERLPVAMTPSGGARNPYEAYVCARHVEGLAPGAYHYAAVDHGLAPAVGGAPPALPALPALLGGQAWFEGAGALVVLVANVRRTMRKYPHPGGLRVVLVEAGHIAQNMLLCAAAHGLAAAPTCALSDEALEALLGLDPIEQAPVYVVALGKASASPSGADFVRIDENPALPGWLGGVNRVPPGAVSEGGGKDKE